jgi:hypothetical protein
MGRRIVTTTQLESLSPLESVQVQADGYFDKVIKYIPGDIVAGWTTLLGLTGGVGTAASGIGGIPPLVFLLLLIAFIALTAWWTHRQTTDFKAGPARTQIIVSTVAFLVWAFALGRPFDQLLPGLYNPQVAAAILIIYTLAVGRIDPRQ